MSTTDWVRSKEVGKLAKKKPKAAGNLGKIDMAVTYENETLTILIKRAENLKKMDMIGQSDPFVYVYLVKDLHSDMILVEKGHEKTAHKNNEANPNFMEEFKFREFNVNDLASYYICAAVYDKDVIGSDFIAGVRIPMSLFNIGVGYVSESFMVNLQTHSTGGHPGEVRREMMEFYGSGRGSRPSTDNTLRPAPIKKTSRKVSSKSKITGKIYLKVDYHDGYLKVMVEKCENLKDTDFIGKADPYVKVYVLERTSDKEVYGDKKKTRTINGNLNPVFDEFFEFKLSDRYVRENYLVLEVWDDDIGKDDIIGGVMFSMSNVDFHQSHSTPIVMDLWTFKKNTRPKEAIIQRQVIQALVGGMATSSSSSSSSSDSEPEYIPPPKPAPIVQTTNIHVCNEKFVKYIMAMQMMTDAYLTRKQIPESITLHEKNKATWYGESKDVTLMTHMTLRDRLNEARHRRDRLRDENSKLKMELESRTHEVETGLEGLKHLRIRYADIIKDIILIRTELEFQLPRRLPEENIARVGSVERYTEYIDAKWSGFHKDEKTIETSNKMGIKIPFKITERIRTHLTEQLTLVRNNFQPHILNMEQYIQQVMEKVMMNVRAIEAMRLAHPEMNTIIEDYRREIMTVESEIGVIQGFIASIEEEIRNQNNKFAIEKDELHREFERLYARFMEELRKRASTFGGMQGDWMRDRLELAIYRKLIEYEEERIRQGAGMNVARANYTTTWVVLDNRESSYSQNEYVGGVGYSSPGIVRKTTTTEQYREYSTSSGVRTSQGPNRIAGSVNSNFDGRSRSSLVNTAGTLYQADPARGDTSKPYSRRNPSVTSGYVTSPGILSPTSPVNPPMVPDDLSDPGSPPAAARRGLSTMSNTSSIFMRNRDDILEGGGGTPL